jgi:hypothetical protein
MITYHIKRVWQIIRLHTRRCVHDIQWHFSHVSFYAKRIKTHFKDKRYNPADDRYWAPLPEDPVKYPFDKEKADAALYEVRQWIREDNKPGTNDPNKGGPNG